MFSGCRLLQTRLNLNAWWKQLCTTTWNTNTQVTVRFVPRALPPPPRLTLGRWTLAMAYADGKPARRQQKATSFAADTRCNIECGVGGVNGDQ